MTHQDNKIMEQLNQCIEVLKGVFRDHLLGVYLYGSSVIGGLQKYSDIDLFVVSERATTGEEKKEISKKFASHFWNLYEKFKIAN